MNFLEIITRKPSLRESDVFVSILILHVHILFFPRPQAVTLHTDVGDIKIELFCERTPKACEVSKKTIAETA